jgi:formylglycine-generating enzyme required for sulfatase activity
MAPMTNRLLQALGWSGVACAVAVCFVGPGGSAPAQDKAKYPVMEPATHKGYTEKLADNVSFTMVPIPGGTFLMGSPKNEKGHKDDEGPQHPVTIKPFWMGKFEVTWDEYDLFWVKKPGAAPAATEKDKRADAVSRPTPPYTDPTFGYGHDGNPALNIMHHAAMEYCRWLSAKTGKYYRLPTEAEWEWACRAGTTSAYSFGDDAAKLDEYAYYDKNSDDQAHKVGQKRPNPWGLYDMHGNVAEWCLDHYVPDQYAKLPLTRPSLMPVVLPTEKRYPHVARGGSWVDPPEMCRSAARRASSKDWLKRDPQRPQSIWWMTDADFVGFRIVRAVAEQENLRNLKSKVTRESN